MAIPEKETEQKLPKCIDFPKIMEEKPEVFETKTKNTKIAGLPKQIEAIKKLLRKSQVDLIESAAKMTECNSTLKYDIKQTNQFKVEISEDFEKLKKSLISTENSINLMSEEKQELQEKLNKLKDQCLEKEKLYNDTRSEYERFLWDILFSLETARNKYEHNSRYKYILI